jgi:maltose alpha-D-glucosyltransferase/alpha-amylase
VTQTSVQALPKELLMAVKRNVRSPLDNDPLWYKDAIIYEVHVRAFADSEDDGVGDFPGLTSKLDYLQDLGVTALWLLPFCPSPLKDDGYDMSSYTDVHPTYGTLNDFETFLYEAHQRGIRVITELALNHTSDQHPWFQRARRAKPGSTWRDFYVWSDTPEKYHEARIIFQDFESSNWSWDPVAHAYYWHRFYSHQPDLNYDNPAVRRAITQVVDFWFGLGVDGLRLDAVPYLYERDGTNCENLAETHAFLKELRRHVDRKFPNRMFLAEANQWPEDAAAYFGMGDECHMNFHFPLMPRLFMAIHTEDRFPIVDILQQTPIIPENCQWGIFLRNHDELTLEMVTDEERDYMYRVYARDPQMRINLGIRRRLAPLLGNYRRRIELMNGLLFSLPGSPVIYYGDEIGMGDNVYLGDRNGVRTPMQWSADRNAGFSRANPQRLYLPVIIDPEYHYEAVNVEAQRNNVHSLFWWMKRLIALRKRHKAFGRGALEFLQPENTKILAFLRRYQDEIILVVTNLSRFAQYVELDLSAFRGMQPIEMFGRAAFPSIGEQPYLLTLGPHALYWFTLETPQAADLSLSPTTVRTITVTEPWERSIHDAGKTALEAILPAYLRSRRWFGGKARQIRTVSIPGTFRFPYHDAVAHLLLATVEYTEGDPETYVLPLAVATGERAAHIENDCPQAVVARLEQAHEAGVLYEAVWDERFCTALVEAVTRRRRFKEAFGELVGSPTQVLRHLYAGDGLGTPTLTKAEQSNTSIVYGDKLIFKLFRRIDEGVNPDWEVGRFLTEKTSFTHCAPVAGALEYRRNKGEPLTVGVLHGFVPNQGDAWTYTLDVLSRYFEEALAQPSDVALDISSKPLLSLMDEPVPPLASTLIGPYLASAERLGQCTAELHLALTAGVQDPRFAPEPFSMLYQRSIYQSMRSLAAQTLQLLRRRVKALPEAVIGLARQVLDVESEVMRRFQLVLHHKIAAVRARYHGDYHLGQVLYTGKDFVIIDFEGEPARPLSERRIKRSPLRDVAGMVRSFHYAVYVGLQNQGREATLSTRLNGLSALEPWARFWHRWVSAVFTKTYFAVAQGAPFLPRARAEQQVLLDAFLLEKAFYELNYELNHRPEWIHIPLRGVLQLLEVPA